MPTFVLDDLAEAVEGEARPFNTGISAIVFVDALDLAREVARDRTEELEEAILLLLLPLLSVCASPI